MPSYKSLLLVPPPDTPPSMDQLNNKRKAPPSPSLPSTPCPSARPSGAVFFHASFASPQTMPKRATVPDLAYLTSPTPSHTANPSQPLTQGTLTAQEPTFFSGTNDMDMSNTAEVQEGVYSSIHAPTAVVPTVPPTPSGEGALPPPEAPYTPGPAHDASTPNELIEALSAIAETTLNMATFSSLARPVLSRYTYLAADNFPTVYRGIPGEFLQGLPPDTIKAWCNVALPKFFVRFFGYDGGNQRERHPSLIGHFRKAIEEIAVLKGDKEPLARIAPPPTPTSVTAHPLVTFLAYGISQHTATTILDQRIWSFPEVTFEATPFETKTIPHLILCIAGFTSPDEQSVEEAVRKVWDEPSNTSRLADIFQQHDASYAGKDLRSATTDAISEVILSMAVEFVDFKEPGGIPSPRFNVYTRSPTSCLVAWSHIKVFLFTLSYPSLLCRVGRPTKLFSCQICHSFSHPRGLCLFPHLPGWNGPKLEPDRRSPTRGGVRGRGKARGGRGAPF